ncbi:MAG: GNAT family N-acetyltransferase [Betaproteobacteria bacterium]|nr:GNAT family N-acetyltransferase [Betaproteobacteria bacterium]
MKTLVLRPATLTDIRPIAEMSRCLIEAGLRGWSWNPARVAAALRHRACSVVVAEVHGQFVGFAIGEFGDTAMHLSLLAVDARRQRKGIGRALMAWLEQSALTAGISDIHLELRLNNHAARAFYESLGFTLKQSVRGYYRGEESARRMTRHIGLPTQDAAALAARVQEKLFKIK